MKEKKIPYGVQTQFSVFEDTMVEMTWQEIQAEADHGAVVLLPVGIVEAHGPHLDLSSDFYISTLNCRFMKQELADKGIKALIAPPFYWGIGRDVAGYAGTFSVRPETMKGLLADIFASLKSWGFKRIFVQNNHGDPLHLEMIKNAVEESDEAPDFRVYFLRDLEAAPENNIEFPPIREDGYKPDYHAGAVETAKLAAFFPEKVRGDVAKTLKPQDTFHPLAYWGDPASFELEYNVTEFVHADVMLNVSKIEAALKRDGK